MLAMLKMRISNVLQVKKTLWKGTIIALPIGVVFWILSGLLGAVNGLGDKLLTLFFPGRHIAWGFGFLVILFFIVFVGRMEVHFEGRERSTWQTIKQKSVGRIPFFGPLLASNKKILSYEDFKRLTPCKFWLSGTTPHYGFIINEQKVKGADTEIDVYRPNVPSIIPGDLFPLKKRLVIKLGNSPTDILDKLTSVGFISSAEEIPIPWDDETEEEFRERINLTPLEIAVKRIIAAQVR
ncbi:MAG: hypothetical protein PHV74_06450 [Dehalococcoidia bacterium]|nr:hypothetical protein [Dehalococcoidia bacterium]